MSKPNVAPPGHPIPQNIAVIGGGLAGLAVTYHLLHSTARWARKRNFDHESIAVTIFDPKLPGEGGASAAAAGLLHPFTPRAKKKAWKSVRSMAAALSLVDVAQRVTPGQSIIHTSGLLRLALTERMAEDFRQASNRFPDEIEFLTPDQIRVWHPDTPHDVPAAYIKDAAVVDTPSYLRNLWQVCKATGRASWRQEDIFEVSSLFRSKGLEDSISNVGVAATEQSSCFDTVVLCAGASLKLFTDLSEVPLTACRGQNMVMEPCSAETSSPDLPLISGKYVIPDYFQQQKKALPTSNRGERAEAKMRMIAGATFEYQDEDETLSDFLKNSTKIDVKRAAHELQEPLHSLVPDLYNNWNVTTTITGTRALPPRSHMGSVPIALKLDGNIGNASCWMFTGLGSRGLLHHAYLGRMLAHAIVAGNEKLIPIDARRFDINVVPPS